MKRTSLLLFILIVILFLTKQFDYITGHSIHYHDSSVGLIINHIFYNQLFNGHFPPLWTSFMNNGEPFWLTAESMPAFDPIALIIWIICTFIGKSGIQAYQISCILWLFTFSLGGMLCSRYILKNWAINFAVFAILFGGPVGYCMSAQSWVLILPFKYISLAIFAFLAFNEKPTLSRAVILGGLLGLSGASYQTVYSFTFISLFVFLYYAIAFIRKELIFDRTRLKLLSISASIALIGLLPTIYTGFKMLKVVPVVRVYMPHGWVFQKEQFLLEPFLPNLFSNWHGSTYIGIIPIFFVLIAFLSAIVLCIKASKQYLLLKPMSILELTWIISFIPTVILTLGLLSIDSYIETHGSFLGVRNWGALITIIVLIFSQLFVTGFKYWNDIYTSKNIRYKGLILLNVSFLLVLIPYLTLLNQDNSIPILINIYVRLALACLILFIILKLAEKNPNKNVLCVLLLLIISANLYFIPSLKIKGTDSTAAAGKLSVFQIKPYKDVFNNSRDLAFDPSIAAPFHSFAPILFRMNSAYLPARTEYSSSASHLFRLNRYESLITSGINQKILMNIFGVTSPIVKIVPYFIKSDSFLNTKIILNNIKDAKTLDDYTVIEGNNLSQIDKRTIISPRNAHEFQKSLKILSYSQNYLKIETNTNYDSFLVFADSYTEDWKAYINGEKQDILISNGINKALFLKKGHNIVEFTYRPWIYIIMFYARLVYTIIFIIFLLYIGINKILTGINKK